MMDCPRTCTRRSRSGVAYILALLMLALCTSFAVAFSSSTNLEIQRGATYRKMLPARLAAESGMDFAIWAVGSLQSDAYLTGAPDMVVVVRDYLAAKLPNHTVAVVNGDDTIDNPRRVTVSSTPLSADQSFSFEVKVTATDAANDNRPSEMELLVTGVSGDISRKVGVRFAVGEEKTLLTYAVASTVRSIIRGNNTVINGNVVSSWSRPVGRGSRSDLSNVAWPIDIGHRNSWYRANEDIRITGRILTTLSEEEFAEGFDDHGVDVSCETGVRDTDMREQVEYGEPPVMNLTHEDFDTSEIRDRPEAPAGEVPLENEKRTMDYPRDNVAELKLRWGRPYKINGVWQTNPAPDPDQPKVVYEYWESGESFWRARYDDQNDDNGNSFQNLHIPQGSHAHFKNCTFKGITYIDTDELTELPSQAHRIYKKYNKLSFGLRDNNSTTTGKRACNNVVFEDCTFEGPVVTGVPKDYRWKQNAISFDGKTVFNSSAITETMAGATILAPNFNINIGDLDQSSLGSESTLVGILVGGIVDIRDNATVHGTILSMANLDHVADSSVWYWGSNLGNWEDSSEGDGSGFVASTNLTITPDPDNVFPLGMKRRYTLVRKSGSYMEYNFE